MTRRKLSILFVSAFVVGACQERLVDGELLEGRHICTWVNAARVYDEQGNAVHMVGGPGGAPSMICLCLTPDDVLSGAYDDWFNDRALETCLEDAARMGYPEANDCEQIYEEKHWIKMIGLDHEAEHLRCDPDGVTEPIGGCSVR